MLAVDSKNEEIDLSAINHLKNMVMVGTETARQILLEQV
jgi:hypothetical protein